MYILKIRRVTLNTKEIQKEGKSQNNVEDGNQ